MSDVASAADELHVVTGAFGYSGRHIAQRLLAAGRRVRTLTGSPGRRHPFGDRIETHPLAFDRPDALARALEGARVLYNTYWVRFNHRDFRFAEAVANTRRLFDAAQMAGVGRVVHVSITNPSEDSPLEYFRGKAELERALRETGLSHAILRPAVLFGGDDVLINNIAWFVRRFPVFGMFGDGSYRLQPIHVDDFADLAVRLGAEPDSVVVDAIGPETYTYRGLVEEVAAALGRRVVVAALPPGLAYLASRCVGALLRDVIVTRDEVAGLMADLLVTTSPPTGTTRLSEWARANRETLGRRYASELRRRRDRVSAYGRTK